MTTEAKSKVLFWNTIIQSVVTYAIFGWVVWVSQSLLSFKTEFRDLQKLVGSHMTAESKRILVMKSLRVHYMNKFPGCRIQASESSFQVYHGGELKVSLVKNGAGMWVCNSAEIGASDCHDLSPLPKEARFMKLFADGSIGRSEEYADRKPYAETLAKEHGKVLSIEELAKRPSKK